MALSALEKPSKKVLADYEARTKILNSRPNIEVLNALARSETPGIPKEELLAISNYIPEVEGALRWAAEQLTTTCHQFDDLSCHRSLNWDCTACMASYALSQAKKQLAKSL